MEGITVEDLSRDGLAEVRKWEVLNTDCLVKIFEEVGMEALIWDVPLVCKSWYKTSLDPSVWKILDFSSLICDGDEVFFRSRRAQGFSSDEDDILPHTYCKPVRCVSISELINLLVNRSQGMTTEVVLPAYWEMNFKDMMQSISEGCPALMSLILPKITSYTSREPLRCVLDLINKWKDLEHLTIGTEMHFNEVLTKVHAHCKNFVGLTTGRYIGSEEASAIVTLLPNIKHLEAHRWSDIPRENLIIILSGCRELELLDVRDCFGFDSDDAEILRMASHIKTFMSKGSILNNAIMDDTDDDDVYESDSDYNYYYDGYGSEYYLDFKPDNDDYC